MWSGLTPLASLAALAVLAGCAAQPEPAPQPTPRPQPQPQPPRPAPPPPTPAAGWEDAPLSQGDWHYSSQSGSSQALFGPANGEATFLVRCERAQRRIVLSREGTGAGPMSVRASNASRNLPTTAVTDPLAYVSAAVGATDPLLDAMVFSRGRFAVELPGLPRLVLPAWPEPARVIEDCRS